MRKLVSQATVIQTQVTPPETSFFIERTGLTEQVYYENLDKFVPTRKLTPLTLRPVVTTYEPDNHTARTATLNSVVWTEVGAGTIVSDGVNYTISGSSLIVRKDVSPSKPITINCEVEYLDPSDAGIAYKVEETVTLNTIFDSTIVHPRLNVLNEPKSLYDPFIDQTSLFTFTAQAFLRGVDVKDIVSFQWYGKQGRNGTPALIDATDTDGFGKFLSYKPSNQPTGKGQGSDTIVLDAMYCDDFYLILRARYKHTLVREPGNVNPHALGWYERTQTAISSPTGNPKSQGWYECIDDIYVPTDDTMPVEGRTYYSITYTATEDVAPVADKRYYTASGDLFPDQVYRMLTWTLPPMNPISYCKNGSQAGAENVDKKFDTIINIPRRVLTDEQKKEHMLFLWKRRRTNVATVSTMGWGQEMTEKSSTLRNTDGSNANVYCEVYVCGCYERVTDSGETVTDNGEAVVDRPST